MFLKFGVLLFTMAYFSRNPVDKSKISPEELKNYVSTLTTTRIIAWSGLGLLILLATSAFLSSLPNNIFYFISLFFFLFLTLDFELFDSKILIRHPRIFLGITTVIILISLFLIQNRTPGSYLPLLLIIPFWFMPKRILRRYADKEQLQKKMVLKRNFYLFLILLGILYFIVVWGITQDLCNLNITKFSWCY